MKGSVKNIGENTWQLRFDTGMNPATGKRIQKSLVFHGNSKQADAKLTDILNGIDKGTYIAPNKETVAAFLDRFLKDYASANLSPRTAEGYESIITQHLKPKLGHIPLTALKPADIQKYYGNLLANGRRNGKGGLNPLTVRHHHMCLHRALGIAVKWGLLYRNPADAIDPPPSRRADMHTMNEAGVQKMLDVVRGTEYYAVFYLAIFTGMRRSELLALRWSDVDLLMGQVSVNRSMHQLRDRSIIFREPKTAKGRRTIALTPTTIQVLKAHLENQIDNQKVHGGAISDADMVFSHSDKSPLLPNSITQAWRFFAKRAGLTGIRLHDARHTHASLMLKQGIHPKIVQERLGHATIATTLDIYSHVAPGLQEAAAQKFDDIAAPKEEKQAIVTNP
jgi:integrase